MAETVPTFNYEPTFRAGIAFWDGINAAPLQAGYVFSPGYVSGGATFAAVSQLQIAPPQSGAFSSGLLVGPAEAPVTTALQKVVPGATPAGFSSSFLVGTGDYPVFHFAYGIDGSPIAPANPAAPTSHFAPIAVQGWTVLDSSAALSGTASLASAGVPNPNAIGLDVETWWTGSGTVPHILGGYIAAGGWTGASKPTLVHGLVIDLASPVSSHTGYGLRVTSQVVDTLGVNIQTEQLKASGPAGATWQIYANGDAPSLFGGALVVGKAALATTATDGFIYAPSCAGAPTGVPVAQTGTVPLVIDTTNSKIMVRIGGAWKGVVVA